MKRLFVWVILSVFLFSFAAPAYADFFPEVDYSERMIAAAELGDVEAGRLFQKTREEKIAALGLDYASIEFDDLLLLSRLIYAEAGSNWLSEDWKMAVGEVVLNRVASPEFPDTIREVIVQPGQYHGPAEEYLNHLTPNRASICAALKLLNGERVLNDPAVVFQSNAILGSGVFLELQDQWLGSTYLCYPSHMELYQD